MKYPLFFLTGLSALLLSQNIYAFDLAPYKWPTPQTVMQAHFTLVDTDVPAGPNWNVALTDAGNSWGGRRLYIYGEHTDKSSC